MSTVKITDNIFQVGVKDPELRNFHGYYTKYGSSYNAYLIIDEKITLIDTVRAGFEKEFLENISEIINPEKIDYIVSNHVEMDHSGALPELLKHCPNAQVVCSPKGKEGLQLHYEGSEYWKFKVMKSTDVLELGEKNLHFITTPMVHWPDNMVEYCPESKILFSNDGFGQHLASKEYFDDEVSDELIFGEAKKYYANIILPYNKMVQKELKSVSSLDVEIIAPSHGLVWRKQVKEIVANYSAWAANEVEEKALVVYDTMWHSTEMIAEAIAEAFKQKNIETKVFNLQKIHISDIMSEFIDAKYICVGSPTLNNNILPTVAGFLAYLKGLSPKKRMAGAFGSFGWSGQSVGIIEQVLTECGFDLLPPVKEKYIPSSGSLEKISQNFIENLN